LLNGKINLRPFCSLAHGEAYLCAQSLVLRDDGSFFFLCYGRILFSSVVCGAYKVPLFERSALESVIFHNFCYEIYSYVMLNPPSNVQNPKKKEPISLVYRLIFLLSFFFFFFLLLSSFCRCIICKYVQPYALGGCQMVGSDTKAMDLRGGFY